MFGAIGDNITDDSAAFQAAIDSGCAVVIPSGNYKVYGISILNPVHIIGINYPRLTVPMEAYHAYDYVPMTIFGCKGGTLEGDPGVNGVIIEGIHFDGNWKAIAEANYEAEGHPDPTYMANRKTHNTGIGLSKRCKNITIRDCKFDNFQSAGIGMSGGVKHITIENCIIGEEGWHGYGWNKGIVCTYSQFTGYDPVEETIAYITLRNNRIWNCGEHGINIYTANKHCIIEGNYVKDCGLLYQNPNPEITSNDYTWGHCIKASGGADLIIANNICINGFSGGIGMFGDTGDTSASIYKEDGNLGNIQIIGNHIIGSDHEKSRGSGIEVGGYLNTIISNNIIENVHVHTYTNAYAVRCQAGSVISNNIIKNCEHGIGINVAYDELNDVHIGGTQISDNMVMSNVPIRMYYVEDAIVSNNILTSLSNQENDGIHIQNCNYCSVNNNSVSNVNIGIFLHLNSSNNTINGNVFKNTKKLYYTHDNALNNTIIYGSLPDASTISF